MASPYDPSIGSVKELDKIIINETNKHNAEVTSIDPDSEEQETPGDGMSHGSSETGSPSRSPFIRNENGKFMPSREVIKYIENIAGIEIDDRTISKQVLDIMKNLEAMCSSSTTSGNHCQEYMNNMKTIFDIEIELAKTLRGKIRKDTALGIVEKQQFRDIWGRHVLNEAKKNSSVCYLCGRPIVPQAPPEMEHKIPSPVMFTTMMHYRQMTMFYADEPNKSQDSVYTRWHGFINNPDNNDNLLKLYKLINGAPTPNTSISNVYPEDGIDTLFNEIFDAFLPDIPYIVRKKKGDFFRYLIKYWLLEFAYSHHLCNQAKSDLPICHTSEKYYNAFSSSVSKRVKTQEKDSKTKQEANMIGRTVVDDITNRKPRTCDMFQHMEDTREEALKAYTTISEVFDGSCNGYQKMISVMVVRSMLALLERNDVSLDQGATSSRGAHGAIMDQPMEPQPQSQSSSDSSSSKRPRTQAFETTDETITDGKLETIGDLKIEINELEDEINKLEEETTTRSQKEDIKTKKTELERKQTRYEELNKPIDDINDEKDNRLITKIMEKLQAISNSCVISGGKRRKTRRRRMGKRSRARRSSRSGSKKTRKRKARKTVHKRRSK
jgi:FtsZ-binding cell division protein ZapB